MLSWQQKARQTLLPAPPVCHCLPMPVQAQSHLLQLAQNAVKINRLPWRFRLLTQPLAIQAQPVKVHRLTLGEALIAYDVKTVLQHHPLPVCTMADVVTVHLLPLNLQMASHPLAHALPAAVIKHLPASYPKPPVSYPLQSTLLTALVTQPVKPALLTTVTICQLHPLPLLKQAEETKSSGQGLFHPVLCELPWPQLATLPVVQWQPSAYDALNLAWQQPILRKALPLQRLPFSLQQQLKHKLAKRFHWPLEKIQLLRVYDRIQEQLFHEIDVNELWQLRCLFKQEAIHTPTDLWPQRSFLVVAKQLTTPLGLGSSSQQWLTALFNETDVQADDNNHSPR
jgi:hypothetical protein